MGKECRKVIENRGGVAPEGELLDDKHPGRDALPGAGKISSASEISKSMVVRPAGAAPRHGILHCVDSGRGR